MTTLLCPGPRCRVCWHANRQDVEAARQAGSSYAALERRFDISHGALHRHFSVCLRQQRQVSASAVDQLRHELDHIRTTLEQALDELATFIGRGNPAGGLCTVRPDSRQLYYALRRHAAELARLSERMHMIQGEIPSRDALMTPL